MVVLSARLLGLASCSALLDVIVENACDIDLCCGDLVLDEVKISFYGFQIRSAVLNIFRQQHDGFLKAVLDHYVGLGASSAVGSH